jgi:hypothetical protein
MDSSTFGKLFLLLPIGVNRPSIAAIVGLTELRIQNFTLPSMTTRIKDRILDVSTHPVHLFPLLNDILGDLYANSNVSRLSIQGSHALYLLATSKSRELRSNSMSFLSAFGNN